MRSSSALIFCRRLVLTTLDAPFTEVHPVSLLLVHERGLGVLRGANGVGGAGALRTGGGCTGRLPQREKKWSTACPLRSQRIAMCAKGRPTSGGKCSTPPSPRGHCWREPFSKSPWRSIERPYFSTSSILKISISSSIFFSLAHINQGCGLAALAREKARAAEVGFSAFFFMGVPPKPPTDPADGLSCAQAWRVGVRKGLCVACPLLELKPRDARTGRWLRGRVVW